MSAYSLRAGALDNVIAHVSGEVRVASPIKHRATALAGARATSRVGAAAAHASPAIQSIAVHARRS
jgi:hypothetical protein